MKNQIMTLAAAFAALLIHSEPAQATGSFTVNGKFAGTAFASVIDLNADGAGARTFDVKAYSQFVFVALQGVADSGLVALPGQGSCSDPAAFELEPFGNITFRGHGDDAVFATIDRSTHLCFNPANPNEVLKFTVTGGTGLYRGRAGSGTAVLHDTTLQADANGFPLVVDTQGEFSITIR